MPLDVPALLRSRIADVPDFPIPGVGFKDISPLLADHVAFAAAVDAVVAHHGRGTVDKVAGIEARGFLLGAPVAYHLGAGFVPVRKAGKLPKATHEVRYDLEYGSTAIQVHRDAFAPGDRVLVVDDVLATGGTAAAAVSLVEQAGAVPVGLSILLELTFLQGRQTVARSHPDLDVHALLTY
ncbi:MAG TPA: adenine phosphoribosyltransferase [Mycobacteriales bacterium]|nr:adenine phosphoribosyltransferase [Mycobacteriales bacterium]